MLKGVYAPSDFVDRNLHPLIPAESKLAVIKSSPVLVTHPTINGRSVDHEFHVTLPFTQGASFYYKLKGSPDALCTDYVNVGDSELYGNGIGTRLLKAAIRYAVEQDPRVTRLHTGWARLGLINAVVSVLGAENVGITAETGEDYGQGSTRPLESVFDDYPPVHGERYLVKNINASIDRDQAMSWDLPVIVSPSRTSL